ncbi:MAG: hypothetical protein MJK15_17470 [Colwellia sp.]|nr:hypothetical protein [Colwellia sp.]
MKLHSWAVYSCLLLLIYTTDLYGMVISMAFGMTMSQAKNMNRAKAVKFNQ